MITRHCYFFSLAGAMIWNARGGCLQDLALVATRLSTAPRKEITAGSSKEIASGSSKEIAAGSSGSKRKHPVQDAHDLGTEPAVKRKCLGIDVAPPGSPTKYVACAPSKEISPSQSDDKRSNTALEPDVGRNAEGSADKPTLVPRPHDDETSYRRALLVLRQPKARVDVIGCSLRGLPLRDLGLCTLVRVIEAVNVIDAYTVEQQFINLLCIFTLGPSEPVGGHCSRMHEGRGPLVLLLPTQFNGDAKSTSLPSSSASTLNSDRKGTGRVADGTVKADGKDCKSKEERTSSQGPANSKAIQSKSDSAKEATAVENVASSNDVSVTDGQTSTIKMNAGDASSTALPPNRCADDLESTALGNATDAKDALTSPGIGNQKKSTIQGRIGDTNDMTAQSIGDVAQKQAHDLDAGANAAGKGDTQKDSFSGDSRSQELDAAPKGDKSRCVKNTTTVSQASLHSFIASMTSIAPGGHDTGEAMAH